MKSLKRIREKRGLSQTKLAQMVGCGQPMISAIEHNLRDPSPALAFRLSKALKHNFARKEK